MRKLTSILYFLLATSVFAQDFHLIQGFVTDEKSEPLIGVYIRVQNTGEGTVTNEKGQYELLVPEGLNRISYKFIGYSSKTIDRVVTNKTVLNVILAPDENVLGAVEIKNKRKDYSYEVIRQAIANKDNYLNQYTTQKRKIYVKSVEENKNIKPPKDKGNKDEDFDPFRNDSIPNLNLFEGEFIQHIAGSKFKQEKLAAKKLNSQLSLFYTSPTDADFTFEENLILNKKLGENPIISPISNAAFAAYKFKLLGSSFESDKKYYKVKVIPRKLGNALFSGSIEVWDSSFALKSVDLSVSRSALIQYDKFSLKQSYTFIDGKKVIADQEFNWKVKSGNINTEGYAIVRYSEYRFDTTYSKKFFNNEVGITKEDAYEKDTSFWASIRPVPLTLEELTFIQYKDSIEQIKTSKWYLDSIDAEYNKITASDIFLNGPGFINREKKREWYFDPLISVLDPVAIGGWRVRYGVTYFKKFESRKTLSVNPFLNYGFLNQDIKGNLNVRFKYDPKKLSTISLNVGRYFGFVNQFATINDVIRRDNFYQQTHAYLYHRTELINGLYIVTGMEHLQREDLAEFKFAALGDSLYENNRPAVFDDHTAFAGVIRLEYTPKQLYIQEPKEKIVLGSRFPTFSALYKQSIPNVFGSSINYKYAEVSVRQNFTIGIFGSSQYSASVGGFLDTTSMRIMDYRYQRGGDPLLFLPPMFGFQQIDTTFPVFRPFFEGHYVHQFNGFLTSKIPGIKHIGLKSMVGGGLLIVPERQYQYAELFGGVNRIIKIGRERLRLGVYYVVSQSNQQGFRSGIKLSFEPYNRDKNTWSF